jgi:hypothetical protein
MDIIFGWILNFILFAPYCKIEQSACIGFFDDCFNLLFKMKVKMKTLILNDVDWFIGRIQYLLIKVKAAYNYVIRL